MVNKHEAKKKLVPAASMGSKCDLVSQDRAGKHVATDNIQEPNCTKGYGRPSALSFRDAKIGETSPRPDGTSAEIPGAAGLPSTQNLENWPTMQAKLRLHRSFLVGTRGWFWGVGSSAKATISGWEPKMPPVSCFALSLCVKSKDHAVKQLLGD